MKKSLLFRLYIAACILTIVALTGCVSATHEHTSKDGSIDKARVTSLLFKADKVRTVTKDGAYTHSTGASGVAGDAAMLEALIQAGIAAGKASVVP